VRALAQRADLAGWHAVYVCDHFMPHDPAGQPADGPMLECCMVLAALAARTSAIALGSLVLGNTYRHPAIVANMAASLDQISQGRLVLGIGAGWQPNEHAAYGIPLSSRRDRVAALDETCTLLRTRLQARLRLLVGGGGRAMLRVAARHADVWHTWADPADFARKNAMLDAQCQEAGRRPADILRACGGAVTVRTGPTSRPAASDSDVQGSPQEVLSRLLAFREAGADEFIVRDDARVPLEEALAQIGILTAACPGGLHHGRLPSLTPSSSSPAEA
jgi:alkanesulfonate monooxygenase SsuD/methylene tetrahydromethanopterin reductase-like flavin-dependent oxidoreductase (luciferase family)